MIQVLIKIYQQRTLREKFLLQGFILVLFVIWSKVFLTKPALGITNDKPPLIELMNQQQWLDREAQYAEALAIALEKVEPSKTFSAAQLSGQVDALIREIKLEGKTDIDPVQTRTSEIFNDLHDATSPQRCHRSGIYSVQSATKKASLPTSPQNPFASPKIKDALKK